MEDYWSLPSLLAEEQSVSVKFLKPAHYIGFLVRLPELSDSLSKISIQKNGINKKTGGNENYVKIETERKEKENEKKNENGNGTSKRKSQNQNSTQKKKQKNKKTTGSKKRKTKKKNQSLKSKTLEQNHKEKYNGIMFSKNNSKLLNLELEKDTNHKNEEESDLNTLRSQKNLESEENEENDQDTDDEDDPELEKNWCCGRILEDEDWVMCDNKNCERKWFHYSCVNITEPPKGDWYCPSCRNNSQFNKNNKKKKSKNKNKNKNQNQNENHNSPKKKNTPKARRKKTTVSKKSNSTKKKQKKFPLLNENQIEEQEQEQEHWQEQGQKQEQEEISNRKPNQKNSIIPENTRTKLPLWLIQSLKWLRTVLIKLPFHYTQKYRLRVLNDRDLTDLHKKSEHYFYTGSFLAKTVMDYKISDEFVTIFAKRLQEIAKWALFWDSGVERVSIPWQKAPIDHTLDNNDNDNDNNGNVNDNGIGSNNTNQNQNQNQKKKDLKQEMNSNNNFNNPNSTAHNKINPNLQNMPENVLPAFEIDELELFGALKPSDRSLLTLTSLTAFTEHQAIYGARLTNLERVIHFFCWINSEKWRLWKERNQSSPVIRNNSMFDIVTNDQIH
ncbi:chromatin modification-related protein yng2 [Anaeramoeba flamelloides]|uniref:Chromatin modification-related protein yng2 n=1 Tax=Anaeramoeba flamelloides TaxID=1746091 RepID=A0ABQ8Z3Y9_9EUKA|nr:chromatin modification-related protein yng2 [Anaeramoeba flamelloides]